MTVTVCLSTDTIGYPEGGGHFWAYLNWALGLQAAGCQVIWLEGVNLRAPLERSLANITVIQERLARYGLGGCLALYPLQPVEVPVEIGTAALDLVDAARRSDLLLNLRYATPPHVVGSFRRSALVDIDPGLTQIWLSRGELRIADHDMYFTTGETVGRPGSLIPDAGLKWHYTPPPVDLNWWRPQPSAADAPFCTVSHWYAEEWIEDGTEVYCNDKRSGFLPFLDLPQRTGQPLELALSLGRDDVDERESLLHLGWRVVDSYSVSRSTWDYQAYIGRARGEFSSAKPSCVRLQNAWVSDRTLCYLASGKPAVVQHTGPSRILPDSAGLWRFRTLDEAANALSAVTADYERQCQLARSVAEDYFDARQVAARVLEQAMD
jgi:hypothetical protein